MTPFRRAALVALPALLLSGCDLEDFDPGSRVKEDFHHTYELKSGARVELESFNGSIEIRGWDKESIDISGTKYAPSVELLKEVKIDIAATPDSIRIRTLRPEGRRGNMGASYVLRLPRKVMLDRIASSNGSLRVQDIEGNARLRSSNGSVKIYDFKGDLDAGTSNGGMELTRFTGGAALRTSNGGIRADGVRGYFEARTSNGGIDAHILEASSRPVRAETSNGHINLSIDSMRDTGVYASSSNSPVTVKLPSGFNARVKAVTSNGGISSDFDISGAGTKSKNRWEGVIGSGGPMLDLHTSNGQIRIQRF
jgi:DUF4097 and DUF4098 domain-containing protein YvlB